MFPIQFGPQQVSSPYQGYAGWGVNTGPNPQNVGSPYSLQQQLSFLLNSLQSLQSAWNSYVQPYPQPPIAVGLPPRPQPPIAVGLPPRPQPPIAVGLPPRPEPPIVVGLPSQPPIAVGLPPRPQPPIVVGLPSQPNKLD